MAGAIQAGAWLSSVRRQPVVTRTGSMPSMLQLSTGASVLRPNPAATGRSATSVAPP